MLSGPGRQPRGYRFAVSKLGKDEIVNYYYRPCSAQAEFGKLVWSAVVRLVRGGSRDVCEMATDANG
jgi:hypothetical protein